MKDEALKLALEALEAGDWYIGQLEAIVYHADDLGTHEDRAKMQAAITAIKQALAAPVQEPVAMPADWFAGMSEEYRKKAFGIATPHAAQRQWVGLTDEEKLHIEIMGGKSDVMLAEMVEVKLKERNA